MTPVRRSPVPALGLCFLCAIADLRADDIALTISKPGTPADATLSWTGGTSPFQLHRSISPQAVVGWANIIARATGSPLTTNGNPAPGNAFFFVLASGACGDLIVDLGEGCDDGGVTPGDGCSVSCQVEQPFALSISPLTRSFGAELIGTVSPATEFLVSNAGTAPSGGLSFAITGSDTADFTIDPPGAGDCVAASSLAVGASCSIDVRFAPQGPGPKSAALSVTSTGGAAVHSDLDGTGTWPLTLSVSGAGTGTVRIDGQPACQTTCPETSGHEDGADVTLVASTLNGSSSYFGGWSGACSGLARTCVVTMTQARTVTATFSVMTHNLAFVSSQTYSTNLGGPTPYDAACNSLASAAGINSAGGNSYIAWISTSSSTVSSRLMAASRGWVRLDSKPFADSQVTLLNSLSPQVWHSLRIDESGVDIGGQSVMTGTAINGTADSNCGDLTGAAGSSMTLGDSAFGGGGWTRKTIGSCSNPRRIYCLMRTKTGQLTVTPQLGKRIFLSTPFLPNATTTPNQRCEIDKPAGMGTVRALVATTTTPASAVLSPDQSYVRPDGILVGTGAELAAAGDLSSGLWQFATGTYLVNPEFAWTGAVDPVSPGTMASTCTNWTSVSGDGAMGLAASSDPRWWSAGLGACNVSRPLYCIEQ